MGRSRASPLVLAACMAAALAATPPSPLQGCAMAGCDPSSSGIVALPLGLSSASLAWAWTAPSTAPANGCGTNGILPASPGCLSQLGNALCAFPLYCRGEDGGWGGHAGFSANGETVLLDQHIAGTSFCAGDSSHSGVPGQLGAMAAVGIAALWDASAIVTVRDGGVQWSVPVYPSAVCGGAGEPGDVLGHISVTNTSRLLYFLSTEGSTFSYFGDGVPVSSLRMHVNGTGSSSAPGVLVPIAPQTTEGFRSVYITRFFAFNGTAAGDASGAGKVWESLAEDQGSSSGTSSGGSSGGSNGGSSGTSSSNSGGGGGEPGPLLAPSGSLLVAAMDDTSTGVARMSFPWPGIGMVLPLPPELAACVPAAAGALAGREPLAIAGPLLLPDGATALFAASCAPAQDASEFRDASGRRAALGHHDGRRFLTQPGAVPGDSKAATSTYVFSVAVASPQPVVPALLWTLQLNGSATGLPALGPATSATLDAASLLANGTAAGDGVVWLAFPGDGVLVAVTGAGQALGAVNLTQAIASSSANGSACPLSPVLAGAPVGTGFVLTARPIATAAGNTSAEGTVLLLAGQVTGPGNNASAVGGAPMSWVLALHVDAAPGQVIYANALWCFPTPSFPGSNAPPGAMPVVGQPAIVQAPSSNPSGPSVIIAATQGGGVFALSTA